MTVKIRRAAGILISIVVIITSLGLFVGCGETMRYNYVSTTMSDSLGLDMSSVFDAMYSGSYIIVGENNITWVIDDVRETLKCKKDGDRVALGGEYLERIKNSMFGGSVEIEYYGQEVGEDYQIVMVEKVAGYTLEIVMNFERA